MTFGLCAILASLGSMFAILISHLTGKSGVSGSFPIMVMEIIMAIYVYTFIITGTMDSELP